MKQYDLIVIGSGAGLMVLEEALNKGLNCAIVEKAELGGTCLTRGCIPSKMLVYPADFIRETEGAMRFGIKTSRPEIDWDVIAKRMWDQINFHHTIETIFQNMPNLTIYKGVASFTGTNTVAIHYQGERPSETILGDKIVIGAGARSFIPSIPGLEECGYITSESFFGKKFPNKPWKRLVIIGSGAIAAEFAHIFSAFGTKVTLLARSERILRSEDPEISEFVHRQFIRNDIDIFTNSTVLSVHNTNGQKRVTTLNKLTKEETVIACEEIFIASGVQSNADTLALENAGVQVDDKNWIVTNSYLETSQKNIWAIGDINGIYQFRHKANYEAQVLMHNLFGKGEKREANYDSVPWAIFTHPQVAHVGMTEQQAKDRGLRYQTAKNYYSEVVGGRSMGYHDDDDDNGFVKMIIGEDKKILGVHIVGPQAAVLLQPFVYLMNASVECKYKMQSAEKNEMNGLRSLCPQLGTYEAISNSMIIHPSLSELTAWVFEKFQEETK